MKTKQNNIRPRDEPSGRSRKPVKKVDHRQSPKQNMNPLERAFTKLAKAFVKKGGTKILG